MLHCLYPHYEYVNDIQETERGFYETGTRITESG